VMLALPISPFENTQYDGVADVAAAVVTDFAAST